MLLGFLLQLFMKTIKLGYTGPEVEIICKTLCLPEKNEYTAEVEEKVREYQRAAGVKDDGIVGPKTWWPLLIDYRLITNPFPSVCDSDYSMFSDILSVSIPALKAVIEVETAGRGGFISPGKPQILFEAHIFYQELKKEKKDPDKLMKEYPNLISRRWNKSLYLGGLKEWDRLEEAKKISPDAALKSTSWGMFQVMGFNYQKCGCSGVYEFCDKMMTSEFQQFILGLEFMRSGNLIQYLQKRDWAGFALRYNGPGYKENNYDVKLEKAFKKYSGK